MTGDIQGVVEFLGTYFSPASAKGLEMFAREGDWLTVHIQRYFRSTELWEIDPKYNEALQKRFPDALIRNVDSIAHANEVRDTFDIISMDNPQYFYGPLYCEHFEILPAAIHLLSDRCAVIFNVNLQPYCKPDSDIRFDEWLKRRSAFYKTAASSISQEFVQEFYRDLFLRQGFACDALELYLAPSKISGHPQFIARCVAHLHRSA